MTFRSKQNGAHKAIAIIAALALVAPIPAQDAPRAAPDPNAQQSGFVLKVNAELVLTNVVARDAKTGELVHDLKRSDFTVLENGKKQEISSFDFQSVDMATPLNEATISGLAVGTIRSWKQGRGRCKT